MITSYDELPPHFKELYKTLPPRLPIPRACEVGGETSRATLYEKIGDGRVAALKDGLLGWESRGYPTQKGAPIGGC